VSLNLHFLLSREAYSHVQQQTFVLLWHRPALLVRLPRLTLASQPSFSRSLFILFFIVREEAPETLIPVTGNNRGCTNPRRQVNWATEFCTQARNIGG